MFVKIQGKNDVVKVNRIYVWEENGHIIMGECGNKIFHLGHYDTYSKTINVFMDITNNLRDGANYFIMP